MKALLCKQALTNTKAYRKAKNSQDWRDMKMTVAEKAAITRQAWTPVSCLHNTNVNCWSNLPPFDIALSTWALPRFEITTDVNRPTAPLILNSRDAPSVPDTQKRGPCSCWSTHAGISSLGYQIDLQYGNERCSGRDILTYTGTLCDNKLSWSMSKIAVCRSFQTHVREDLQVVLKNSNCGQIVGEGRDATIHLHSARGSRLFIPTLRQTRAWTALSWWCWTVSLPTN